MNSPRSVLIIGGGAVGLFTAWELTRLGCEVKMVFANGLDWALDSNAPRCTPAAAGILPAANLNTAQDPIDQLRGLSHRLWNELAEPLEKISQQSIGYQKCGGLYVATSPGEAATNIGMKAYLSDMEIDHQAWSAKQWCQRFPRLDRLAKQSIGEAIWVPDDRIVEPRFLIAALVTALQKQNASIESNTVIESLHRKNGDWIAEGRRTDKQQSWQTSASHVVVCSGVGTSPSDGLADQLGLQQNVIPVRGQMLRLASEPAWDLPVINRGHRYLVPRNDGTVLVGSNEEEVGHRIETTDTIIDELRRFAEQTASEFSNATEQERWAGLRPMKFDGFPYLGEHPQYPGVFVSTGHFRSGIHLSTGTASCLAALVLDSPTPIDVTPFSIRLESPCPN